MTNTMVMVGFMSRGTKTVQTELATGEYARLRELAEAEGRSIKEALRRATSEWIDTHDAIPAQDPLVTVPDGDEVPTSGRSDAEAIEAERYDPCDRSRYLGSN